MIAILTLLVWAGAFVWLGWRGLVVAAVATFVEWATEVRGG